MDSLKGFDMLLTLVIGFFLGHFATHPTSFTFSRTLDTPPQVVAVVKHLTTTIREEIEQHAQTASADMSLSTFIIYLLSVLVLLLFVVLCASHADTCVIAIDTYNDEFFGLSTEPSVTEDDCIYISTSMSTRNLLPDLANVEDASTATELDVSLPEMVDDNTTPADLPPPPSPSNVENASSLTEQDVFVRKVGRFAATAPRLTRPALFGNAFSPALPQSDFSFKSGHIATTHTVAYPSGSETSGTTAVKHSGSIFNLEIPSVPSVSRPPFAAPVVAMPAEPLGTVLDTSVAGPSGEYRFPGIQLSEPSTSPYGDAIIDLAPEMSEMQRGENIMEGDVVAEGNEGEDKRQVADDGIPEVQAQSRKKKNKMSKRQRQSKRRQAEMEAAKAQE